MRLLGVFLATWLLAGCASIVSSVTSGLAEDISAAILNNDDMELVRDGAPAFLILLDALLSSDPDNPTLLAAAATLNASYSTAFVTDPERRSRLANKAMDLSFRAACVEIEWACDAREMPFADLEEELVNLNVKQTPAAYALATGWAGWIQTHNDDWNAVAELGRVKTIMARIAELDEGYDYGGAQMYLGVFETLLPPALGGRPELGRVHFERAIEINGGDYLLAKVLFAERYGRLVFDRELHDTLLGDVVEANPRIEGLTFINVVAQAQAQELLETADEYF